MRRCEDREHGHQQPTRGPSPHDQPGSCQQYNADCRQTTSTPCRVSPVVASRSGSPAATGHTASLKYIKKISAWVHHQFTSGTPNPNPADSLRGMPLWSAANNSQLVAKPAYSGQCRRHTSRHERLTKIQSNSNTISGAETITSFDAAPARQADVATTSQVRRWISEPAVQ